jgi:hypothetical protein
MNEYIIFDSSYRGRQLIKKYDLKQILYINRMKNSEIQLGNSSPRKRNMLSWNSQLNLSKNLAIGKPTLKSAIGDFNLLGRCRENQMNDNFFGKCLPYDQIST